MGLTLKSNSKTALGYAEQIVRELRYKGYPEPNASIIIYIDWHRDFFRTSLPIMGITFCLPDGYIVLLKDINVQTLRHELAHCFGLSEQEAYEFEQQ